MKNQVKCDRNKEHRKADDIHHQQIAFELADEDG
jgi:hypothetical protein